MGFHPLDWYCRPVQGGMWSRAVENAFGVYTPCGMQTVVLGISHLALFGVCFYRIWRTTKDLKVQRYIMKSKTYSYVLMIFAAFCVAEALCRVVMGYSTMNLDGQSSLAPFEVLTLLIEAAAWSCMLVMLITETKIYIREFRWYIRFVMIYVLIGEITVFNLVFSIRDYLSPTSLYLYVTELACKFLFGILLMGHLPSLEPYSGYTPLRSEILSENMAYEPLASEESICPERHVNIFSRILFSWMTPLIQQGHKRPITDKDIWKLDTWDQTETTYTRFQQCWIEETDKPKPWLLRALNGSLGGRFWLGGIFKNPVFLLSHVLVLLQLSSQQPPTLFCNTYFSQPLYLSTTSTFTSLPLQLSEILDDQGEPPGLVGPVKSASTQLKLVTKPNLNLVSTLTPRRSERLKSKSSGTYASAIQKAQLVQFDEPILLKAKKLRFEAQKTLEDFLKGVDPPTMVQAELVLFAAGVEVSDEVKKLLNDAGII